MSADKIPVIVIAGPTAVGKTDLSIDLAHHFQGEVINGDSMQVYQGLDIGTGKVTEVEMKGVPHHLLDICRYDQSYDASRFKAEADQLIHMVAGRGHLPLVVGGTGLYLEGLLYDLEFGHQSDPQLRQALEGESDQLGALAMWERLHALDPAAAAKIPYQNLRRTIRALEVIELTGEKFSDQLAHREQASRYHELILVLDRPRQALYDRINRRVELMVDQGLEAEARQLYEAAGEQDYQSVRGIGYKEWWPYFQGEADLETVVQTIQQHSRRYAKRQLTWFRNRFKQTHWLDLSNPDQAYQQAIDLIQDHLAEGE